MDKKAAFMYYISRPREVAEVAQWYTLFTGSSTGNSSNKSTSTIAKGLIKPLRFKLSGTCTAFATDLFTDARASASVGSKTIVSSYREGSKSASFTDIEIEVNSASGNFTLATAYGYRSNGSYAYLMYDLSTGNLYWNKNSVNTGVDSNQAYASITITKIEVFGVPVWTQLRDLTTIAYTSQVFGVDEDGTQHTTDRLYTIQDANYNSLIVGQTYRFRVEYETKGNFNFSIGSSRARDLVVKPNYIEFSVQWSNTAEHIAYINIYEASDSTNRFAIIGRSYNNVKTLAFGRTVSGSYISFDSLPIPSLFRMKSFSVATV